MKKIINSNNTLLKDVRDFIRFMTVLLFIPWFGGFTSAVFGFEVEFETELAVLLTILICGPFWCGWICPFGNLSYFMNKVSQKLFPSIQLRIPEKIDRPLRYLKYVFLAIFLYVIFSRHIDYFFGDHMEMYFATGFTTAFIITKKYAVLLVPFLIPRFFCKYMCFQKGAYNIINKFFPFTEIRRDDSNCIQCGKCDNSCPMDINISKIENTRGKDCVGCYSCVDEKVCPPKKDALHLTFLGRKVNPMYMAAAVLPSYYLITYIILKF